MYIYIKLFEYWPSGPVQLHQRGQFHLRSGCLTFNVSAKPAETQCKKSPPPSIIFEGGDFQADRVCEAKISMVRQARWTWSSATKPNIDFPIQRLSPELPVVPRNSLNSIDNSSSAIDFVLGSIWPKGLTHSPPQKFTLRRNLSAVWSWLLF